MKDGKITEPVWKRSVLRKIKNRRQEILVGPGVGRAGNLLDMQTGKMVVSSEADFLSSWKKRNDISAKLIFNRAINACAAMGAEPIAVQVQLLCPAEFMESDLQDLMRTLEKEAEEKNVSLLPGRIESAEAVSAPYLTLNGIGRMREENFTPYQNVQAGQELVLSKWIALESTALLAEEHEKELLERYTPVFVDHAQELIEYISTVPEAAVAVLHGATAMLHIEEGGIFGALWNLAEGVGLGLEVQVKAIPVKQETIEICELYNKNPYLLPSAGCLLMVTEQGEALKRELERAGIPATVIGRLTDGNERVLLNEDEKRFLELPKMNELRAEKTSD